MKYLWLYWMCSKSLCPDGSLRFMWTSCLDGHITAHFPFFSCYNARNHWLKFQALLMVSDTHRFCQKSVWINFRQAHIQRHLSAGASRLSPLLEKCTGSVKIKHKSTTGFAQKLISMYFYTLCISFFYSVLLNITVSTHTALLTCCSCYALYTDVAFHSAVVL